MWTQEGIHTGGTVTSPVHPVWPGPAPRGLQTPDYVSTPPRAGSGGRRTTRRVDTRRGRVPALRDAPYKLQPHPTATCPIFCTICLDSGGWPGHDPWGSGYGVTDLLTLSRAVSLHSQWSWHDRGQYGIRGLNDPDMAGHGGQHRNRGILKLQHKL